MTREVALQGLLVQAIGVQGRVVDGQRRHDLEHDGQVAGLEVEVDQGGALLQPFGSEDSEVGGHQRLPAAALGGEHGHDAAGLAVLGAATQIVFRRDPRPGPCDGLGPLLG